MVFADGLAKALAGEKEYSWFVELKQRNIYGTNSIQNILRDILAEMVDLISSNIE